MTFPNRKYLKVSVSNIKKKQQTKMTNQKVRRIVNSTINRNVEWKFHLYENSLSVPDTGLADDPSLVSQGATDTTRNGDKIQASSFKINYYIENGDSYNNFRVIVFQWYQSASPLPSDVLLQGTGFGNLSQYNIDKAPSYKIMYDRTHLVSSNYSGQTNGSRAVHKKLRVPRKNIQYNAGSTGGIGKVYLLFISDSSAALHPTVHYSCKLIYKDC